MLNLYLKLLIISLTKDEYDASLHVKSKRQNNMHCMIQYLWKTTKRKKNYSLLLVYKFVWALRKGWKCTKTGYLPQEPGSEGSWRTEVDFSAPLFGCTCYCEIYNFITCKETVKKWRFQL